MTSSHDKILKWDTHLANEIALVQTNQPVSKVLLDRVNENLLISVHAENRTVKVWDLRQFSQEIYQFEAHDTDIRGIDIDY